MTIQDVARRAGVSTATVSRAIALPDRVTEATRAAVFAAIRETGYTPNAAARSLRAKSTKMVLVLLPGIGNSFFTPVLNALEEVFTEGGYGVLIGYTRQSRSRETHYARVIRAGQVDGVLVVTGNVP
ncbi:MAG: LacI family DNA-binding transcriptional regulator, partial [Rhizobiales bacterium]|nr:LacI family DNA-binding transcriptional regulator [Hyphomicrobiales bacterium]